MQTLFFIVFLDLVGFGMIIPVLPYYAETVGVPDAFIVFLFGLYSLGQLFGAPIWGALSDRVGRRPVLIGTLAANAAANLLLAVAGNWWQLALSRLVAGLAAGNISTAYAYVTDITDEKTRPRSLGILGAAFGLGFIVGPSLGGFLAGAGDSAGSLARCAHAAALMSAAACLSTVFFLRESHGPAERAHATRLPRPNRWQLMKRPVLRELLGATLLVVAGVAMFQSAFTVWSAKALGVTPRMLGALLGAAGVLSVIIQGGAIGALTRRFGTARLTAAGAVFCALAMAGLLFAASVPGTFAPIALYAIGSAIFVPSISTLVAATAGATERGAVLGVFQSASATGRVVGPFLASAVVRLAGLKWPFAVGAAISLGALGVLRLEPAGEPASPAGDVTASAGRRGVPPADG